MSSLSRTGDQPDAQKLKKLIRASWAVSILVLGIVLTTERCKVDIGMGLPMLPPLHSLCNLVVAISLVIAVISIKAGKVGLHKRFIGVAVVFSSFFLLSYVLYHSTQESVKFGGGDSEKLAYYSILFSHIILAGVSLPFILITLSLGYTNHFERHKKMARWVFPVWLYVALTGPIAYLMLRPYY